VLRTSRPAVACILTFIFGLAACTSDTAETTTELTVSVVTTETTVAPEQEPDPPVVLARKGSLSLNPGECYSDLTIDQPRKAAAPESPWVDVVDCNGTHFGDVYAVGCLGVSAEPEDGKSLVAVACPGQVEDIWPGKVELQRSSVKACLSQFEAVYSQSYAETELRAVELLPSEETWLAGERRVICAIRGS
jgi:hypothetical protein